MNTVEKITADNGSYEINDLNALQHSEVTTIEINGNTITYNGTSTQTAITYNEQSPIKILDNGTIEAENILVQGSPVITQIKFDPIERLKFSPLYMSQFAKSVSYNDDFYDSHIKIITNIQVEQGVSIGSLVLTHEYGSEEERETKAYTATFDGLPLINKASFDWSIGILTVYSKYDDSRVITLEEPESYKCREIDSIEIKKMPGENVFHAEERDTISVGWDYEYQARYLTNQLREEMETEIEALRTEFTTLKNAWKETYQKDIEAMIQNQMSTIPTIWYGTNLADFTTIPNTSSEESESTTQETNKPKPGDLFVYITGDNSTPDSSTDYYVRRAQLPELVDEIIGDIADGSY